MTYEKQRSVAKLVFGSILLLSAPLTALAFTGQSDQSPFQDQSSQATNNSSTSQQQRSTSASSSQSDDNYQMDDSATPNLTDGVVLGSSQSRNGLNLQDQTLQNQNQLTQRNGRPISRTQREQAPPLSDFQRLVAASVGKVLPIYGAKLFINSPTTFAPVNRIPVTPNYVIGPGDELLVRIWGQVTLDGRYTVDRSGSIYIPQVGTVHVSGVPFEKLTDFLRSQIGRVFANFDLNVNMGQLRSIQIFVVGEAMQPGSYTVSSLSTLVNAIFASGGPSPTGSMRNIQVRRGNEVITTFDLYDLLLKGDKSKDVPLSSGDVVYFAPVGPMVALAGSIDKPALYEVKDGTTIADALALSGGLATLARHKDVRVERVRQRDDTRAVVDIDLENGGMGTPLADGDILEIFPIIDRFKDAVTLRGNVANPRRFAWHPGMRIRDLIPDKEALLTRDYWQQRNQLGLPVLDSTPDVRRDAPEGRFDSDMNVYGAPVTGNANSITRNSNSGSTGSDATGNVPPTAGTTGANGTSTSASNNVGGNSRAAGLAGNNVLSSRESSNDSAGDSATGSSVSAIVTGATRRFPIKNGVVLNAPEIDWAYAVIERRDKNDLTSTLLSFNLGRAVLQGDESQNLALEPGDVVTIFSNADIRVPQDQQTKFVRLEGEFVGAGVYRVAPGETLRHLVARAGGLSSKAYLYGSQFTRDSARVVQQQRINEYANDLDRRIKLAEANAANTALNPQDQVTDIAALQNARSVSMSLHQSRASGRIVLAIKPDASSLQDIPDIALEDGDSFIVPQVPLSVGVFGSVYTQNLFTYDAHKRAKDYLRQAGGGTRTADVGRSYIVRADGSILSRQFTTALFTGNFDSTHLYPGDSVIVPEQVDKRPLLRNLVDIATIVGQFGLGIAAINVLK
jgi:protein involved in polysaccharide export with SLBB domain